MELSNPVARTALQLQMIALVFLAANARAQTGAGEPSSEPTPTDPPAAPEPAPTPGAEPPPTAKPEPPPAAEPEPTSDATPVSAAAAPSASTDESSSESGWYGDRSGGRLNLTVPLWLPFLALDSTLITETDTEILETESTVAWVVIGSLEAGYKALAARIDVFGIGFRDQIIRRNGETSDASVESSGFVGRGIVMYEFGPWRLNDPKNQASVSPLAGARYNRVSVETGERTDLEGTYDWIDPLVGVRSEFRFGDVRLGAHIDVGGFTVGSDLAFWGAFTAEYMFTSWFAGWAGWQHYQVFFKETNADEVDTLQLMLTGPSAGVSFYIL